MGDLRRQGRDAFQQVVDTVGTTKVCKVVDSQLRSLVADALYKTGGGTRYAANRTGQAVAREMRQVCTDMTPEGRTLIVLAGATAGIVYGVMNYDELEPKIKEALRRAKVPIKVPLERARIPGELTLSVNLDREFAAQYKLDNPRGHSLEIDLEKGKTREAVSLGYGRDFGNTRMSAGIEKSRDHRNGMVSEDERVYIRFQFFPGRW